ncbi:hypothetical protein POM88_044630 [Heracleum sosnowskyi]|uniref:Bicarbonate transporter-like transmembrane domain-containing protein n=1 Tax=Heracleum sosnowskyi TaxID=360622 RepID=A0AAD8H4E7_9APIA|nr:hypothetical protein POM88_044630 [Heracleum sosnowskyi]
MSPENVAMFKILKDEVYLRMTKFADEENSNKKKDNERRERDAEERKKKEDSNSSNSSKQINKDHRSYIIFSASAIPVIAFGRQLERSTYGSLTVTTMQTLASAIICGIIHTIMGGQPLLILRVAEPTVPVYAFVYNFANDRPELGPKLFLAWTGWVCVWTAILLFLLAILGACSIINRFTRLARELLGLLIAMLFVQEAIKVRALLLILNRVH